LIKSNEDIEKVAEANLRFMEGMVTMIALRYYYENRSFHRKMHM
jgi:hypothetical protein